VVLHERFTLSKSAASPSGSQPSASNTNSGSSSDREPETWRIEEGWQLRRLDREELLALAADAGMCETSADVVRVMGCEGSPSAGGGAGLADGPPPGVCPGEGRLDEGHGSHFVVLQHAAGK
jgi:hypothetical protein